MCSVICRVRMEFISCRVLRENIPHKPSPWWVGEGRGRLQTSWKTGDRTKTKGAPGLRPPAPVNWEGTTSRLLCCCKGTLECLHPILADPNYTSPPQPSSVFQLSGGHPACCCPYRAGGWTYCSAGVGQALCSEDSQAGGLQVLGELSGEGIRVEVKCWVWESGSLNSSSTL